MLKEHLTALKHGQVTARHTEKGGNKFTVWHKYYTDDLSDINIDTKFNTCQVLGSYDMKPSFKVDF